MTKLMRELLADPDATFEIEADLPSGNTLYGTVGPIIGSKMQSQVGFANTATDEDVKMARMILDRMVGMPPAKVIETHSTQELTEARRDMRRFMGGGEG